MGQTGPGEFIHSCHANAVAVGGTDTTVAYRMPVLPVTCVYITLNAQLTTANTSDSVTTLLSALTSVQYRFRGTQVWSMNGLDLYRVTRAMGIFGMRPELWNKTLNSVRTINLVLPFGRRLYDYQECFPAVAQGETELALSFTAAPSGYNTLSYNIDSVQLIDGQPTTFIRGTTFSDTPAAAGDKDYDLPRAAPLVGVGIHATATYPASTSPNISLVKVLANNQDYMYAQATPSTLRAMSGLRRSLGYEMDTLIHGENTGGAYTQNADTLTARFNDSPMSNYFWLPFDVYGDDSYIAPANLFQDFKMRLTFANTGAVRFTPIELWSPDMLTRSKSNPAAVPLAKK